MASDVVAQATPTSAGLQFTDLPQEIQKEIISHVSASNGPPPLMLVRQLDLAGTGASR